jgi:hypothetical protein
MHRLNALTDDHQIALTDQLCALAVVIRHWEKLMHIGFKLFGDIFGGLAH